MNNRKVLLILISFAISLFVIIILSVIFVIPKTLEIFQGLKNNEKVENTNVGINDDVSDLPSYSLNGLAHVEMNEDGIGKLYYTDIENSKQIKIDIKENPIEVGQVYGGKWLIINTSESGILVLDKVTGKWKSIDIPKISGYEPVLTYIPNNSVSYDGKYAVLSIGYNDPNSEEMGLSIKESNLYIYNFEKNELSKIFNVKGEYNVLGYTWSEDQNNLYITCPPLYCTDFEGLNGVIEVNIDSLKYSQVLKPVVLQTDMSLSTNPVHYTNNGDYILINESCCNQSQIIIEKNKKQVVVDSGYFAEIQDIKNISKDNKYGIYERQAGDLSDGLPFFNLMILDIINSKKEILVKADKSDVFDKYYWISKNELAYLTYTRNEEGYKSSSMNWKVVNIDTKEIRSVL